MTVIRIILKLFFVLLAVFLLLLGMATFTVRQQLLQSTTYKSSLSQTQAYPLLSEIIDTQVTDFLQSNSEESPSSFDQEVASLIYDHLSKKIDYEEILQITAERNIDNTMLWANSDRTDIIIFLPKNELQTSIDEEELKKEIIEYYLGEVNDLPDCRAFQLLDFINAWESGDLSDLECVSVLARSEIESQILGLFPEDVSLFDETWRSYFGNLDDEIALRSFMQEDDVQILSTFEGIKQAQYYIDISKWIPISLIGGGLISVIFAMVMAAKSRLKIMSNTIALSGVLTLLSAFLVRFNVETLVRVLPFQNISQSLDKSIFNADQQIQLIEIITQFFINISKMTLNSMMVLSALVLLGALIISALITLFTRKRIQQSLV